MKFPLTGLLLLSCLVYLDAMEDPRRDAPEKRNEQSENVRTMPHSASGRGDNVTRSIHLAAIANDPSEIEAQIFMHGALIEAHNEEGYTPLDVAFLTGRPDAIAWLVRHGAIVHHAIFSTVSQSIRCIRPVMYAVLMDDKKLLRRCLDKALTQQSDIAFSDLREAFPLVVALDRREMAHDFLTYAAFFIDQLALEHGAIAAAATGNTAALQALCSKLACEAGAMPNEPIHMFESIIYWATIQGHHEIACKTLDKVGLRGVTLLIMINKLNVYLRELSERYVINTEHIANSCKVVIAQLEQMIKKSQSRPELSGLSNIRRFLPSKDIVSDL